MTFDNLEVSVHLNKSEPPSLTMAFYMIQNLIKDVETAAGTKFKNVDMGNSDEFPVLLAGQCRMIKAVYESNAEHITRNQDRLAQLSGVLSDIQRELDQGADISQKICEKEKEYEDILQKSKKLLEDKKKYEELSQECDRLSADVEKMEHYDITAKEKEAERLREKYRSFDVKKRNLSEELAAVEADVSSLDEDISRLSEKLSEKQGRKSELEAIKESLEKELANTESTIPGAENEVDEKKKKLSGLNAKMNALQSERENLESQISSKQEEYNKFYNENTKPLQEEYDGITSKINNAENEKNQLAESLDALKKHYSGLLETISSLQVEISETKSNTDSKEAQRLIFEGQKAEYQKQYDEINGQTAKIQSETLELSTVRIPQAQELLNLTQKSNGEKQAKLDGIASKIDSAVKESAVIEKKIKDNDAMLSKKTRELSELRAKYYVNSEEVSRLERQLEELKGKTDKEKTATLRGQLESDIEELKKLEEEEKTLTEECGKIRNDIQEENQTVEKLRRNKSDYETKYKEVRSSLEELRYLQTEEFISRFERVRDRAYWINSMKNRLSLASEKLSRAVGNRDSFNTDGSWSEISADLQEIDSYISGIQNNILDDAKKIFAEGEL